MLDYILVGSGLAGISFAETLIQHNKSFVVYDTPFSCASRVAAGIYNPVVLKRFTLVWDAENQLQLLTPFYASIAQRIGVQVDFKLPMLRKLSSTEEQNNWFVAADKPGLTPFLSTSLCTSQFNGIQSPFHYGEVLHTGFVDVPLLLDQYHAYLKLKSQLIHEPFVHAEFQIFEDHVLYRGVQAKNIVFAEGFAMHANSWFNHLPLDGVKGELIIIKAPELQLDKMVNSSIFILPLGEGLFKVGATYNWEDKSNSPTEQGLEELLSKLKEVICCEFELIHHYAGIRPTVKDRKPIVGTHPLYKQLHLLNGLGTRGVLLGPYLSDLLYQCIEHDQQLPAAIDIKRFAVKNSTRLQ
jgi:glycine/D-amino acid oxidase-like deaminating enzyme